jgi:GNAT superfamily N-acetyltransferase
MSLHVRGYERSDAERCCEIISGAVGEMAGLNDAARRRVRANTVPGRLGVDLERWATVVVESVDGLVVGVGTLNGDEVEGVYVDPAEQGHGVGTAVMAALEFIARARRAATLRLDASAASVGFFESLGYERGADGIVVVEEAVFQSVHMIKDVRPTS